MLFCCFLPNNPPTIALEKFEDTKGVIRSRKPKNQTMQWPKEKGRTTRIIINGWMQVSGGVSSSCYTNGTRRVVLVQTRSHFLTFWLNFFSTKFDIYFYYYSINTNIFTFYKICFCQPYIFCGAFVVDIRLRLSTNDNHKVTVEMKIWFSALKVLYNGNIYCSWHQYCYSLMTVVPWTLF